MAGYSVALSDTYLGSLPLIFSLLTTFLIFSLPWAAWLVICLSSLLLYMQFLPPVMPFLGTCPAPLSPALFPEWSLLGAPAHLQRCICTPFPQEPTYAAITVPVTHFIIPHWVEWTWKPGSGP